jgi:hypothetical protein
MAKRSPNKTYSQCRFVGPTDLASRTRANELVLELAKAIARQQAKKDHEAEERARNEGAESPRAQVTRRLL